MPRATATMRIPQRQPGDCFTTVYILASSLDVHDHPLDDNPPQLSLDSAEMRAFQAEARLRDYGEQEIEQARTSLPSVLSAFDQVCKTCWFQWGVISLPSAMYRLCTQFLSGMKIGE